jgi:N-dimethylarginine dimethylaminohydrolase
MCPPTHFDVVYSINPWMEPDKPVDGALAQLQWEGLLRAFHGLGHQVEFIKPLPGYPDMVFAANGATVIEGKVLSARFRHPERAAEGPAYLEWFRSRGYETRDAVFVNEGEGDYLHAGRYLLAGTGFRTDIRSHREAERFFGMPVAGLRLVDPRFYHLDTALAVLDDDQIMYYPGAFAKESQGVLRVLYPDAVIATEADAEVFGLNAVSDGRHVLMPPAATHLMDELRERGYEPIGVELSELLKSGGSAKCCTLELRAARR